MAASQPLNVPTGQPAFIPLNTRCVHPADGNNNSAHGCQLMLSDELWSRKTTLAHHRSSGTHRICLLSVPTSASVHHAGSRQSVQFSHPESRLVSSFVLPQRSTSRLVPPVRPPPPRLRYTRFSRRECIHRRRVECSRANLSPARGSFRFVHVAATAAAGFD